MRIHTKLFVRRALLVCLGVAGLQLAGPLRTQTFSPRAVPMPPNILFIILDDVGKDLLASFNPAAPTAQLTPNINTIIAAGVKFTNFYTMPECSPSRAAFFTGRFAFRTGVNAAILSEDLPGAQVSPFETTTPRVLATAGYKSALIGKYHLGGPENNPEGNNAPVSLGWDYFNGNMRGGPPGIDTSLGGQYTKDTTKYASGFPVGIQRGASWFQSPDGHLRCDDNIGVGFTGQEAVALGGIPALNSGGDFALNCGEASGPGPDFTLTNGYYVWPQVIADASGIQSGNSRQYMTTAQTDAAIEWIKAQGQDVQPHPWMATLSYNAIHTPYQEPPVNLYPPGFVWPSDVPENAQSPAALPILTNLMLAAMDHEIGRLLVGSGLAEWDTHGRLVYKPEASNTMIVIAGDNGTYLASVQSPYDPTRSKGTPYETGVLAPLIVSGPLVNTPGRTVDHLVNCVDLFQLFGEIAGVDVARGGSLHACARFCIHASLPHRPESGRLAAVQLYATRLRAQTAIGEAVALCRERRLDSPGLRYPLHLPEHLRRRGGPMVRTDNGSTQSTVPDQLRYRSGRALQQPDNFAPPGLGASQHPVQIGTGGAGFVRDEPGRIRVLRSRAKPTLEPARTRPLHNQFVDQWPAGQPAG